MIKLNTVNDVTAKIPTTTMVKVNKPHLANNPLWKQGGHGKIGYVKSNNGDKYVIGFNGVNEMCFCDENQLIII